MANEEEEKQDRKLDEIERWLDIYRAAVEDYFETARDTRSQASLRRRFARIRRIKRTLKYLGYDFGVEPPVLAPRPFETQDDKESGKGQGRGEVGFLPLFAPFPGAYPY